MLLVLPLHGRALRPIGRALDPWKLVRRMLPNTARDLMLRPAGSSGPTCDRPGQPSGPLRMRGLTGGANDQAWLSSFAGSRLLLRAGAWLRVFFTRVRRNCDLPQITRTCALFVTWPGPRRPSATLELRLRCHPTSPGLDVEDIRGNPGLLRDEPFRRCLGLFTKISWIDERCMIWMQEAFCHFDPIIRNTKHVFVLRSLMMNTHLFRP